jgi:sodium/proline symporter
MLVTRVVLLTITLIGIIIALDENSVIFKVVSFAWAGFGATFGPLVLFSLFWKRTTHSGALAGMIAGGGMVFFWKLVLRPLGGVLGIYELLPAFLFSSAVIVLSPCCRNSPIGPAGRVRPGARGNGALTDAARMNQWMKPSDESRWHEAS